MKHYEWTEKCADEEVSYIHEKYSAEASGSVNTYAVCSYTRHSLHSFYRPQTRYVVKIPNFYSPVRKQYFK